MSKEDYKKELIRDNIYRWNDTEERATESAESHIKQMEKDKKLMEQFEDFVNKLNTTCGCLVGEGELTQYEQVKVTEYKTENKAVESTSGSIKDGQCFILKTGFNYGHFQGLVYRIHESEYNNKKYYHAYKLNGKLTKECTGMASTNNSWNTFDEKFLKWIEKGCISWCEIQEVKTPYEVEKVVKKVIRTETGVKKEETDEAASEQKQSMTTGLNGLQYDITEDTDTRDNSKIYVVKVVEKLDKDEYIKVNNNMKSIGGYYSKFKHGFIFKEDPTELLNGNVKHDINETQEQQTEEVKQPEEKQIDFEVEQQDKIWLVKIKDSLSKEKFAEVKRNFATLKGFYSGLHSSFIFKYDPTEKIKITV
jgi:hypothetical protein